jgi:ribosomal 30S subunit maturation factor RimM
MIEQDWVEDIGMMSLMMMMMSDDNLHIDDNRQDNSNVMIPMMNPHILSVHIRDEHHELKEVQLHHY